MAPKVEGTQAAPTRAEKIKAFVIKHYLPLAFLVALGFALAYPVPGRYLANIAVLGNVRIVQVAAMALVFLITGLQLNTAELKRALAVRNLPNVVYGFVAILAITPCLGFALREAPLTPPEFAIGLAIFCVAPTTLGVGVALTEACGGNRATALLLTIGTNALAVLTMPPELRLLLPSSEQKVGSDDGQHQLNLDFQITDLLIKLAVTVLVPFTIGKTVRELWPACPGLVKEHRVALSLTSTTALAFVVWQTLSAARDLLLAQRPGPVFAMMGLAVAQHLAYLVANYLVVWFGLRAPLKEAIAVVIMSSQKSAPVAVTAITFMTKDSAQQGLLSLPSIVGQLIQIFVGAGIARWLSGVVKRADRAEAAAAATAAATAAAADGSGAAGATSDAVAIAVDKAPLDASDATAAASAASAKEPGTASGSATSSGLDPDSDGARDAEADAGPPSTGRDSYTDCKDGGGGVRRSEPVAGIAVTPAMGADVGGGATLEMARQRASSGGGSGSNAWAGAEAGPGAGAARARAAVHPGAVAESVSAPEAGWWPGGCISAGPSTAASGALGCRRAGSGRVVPEEASPASLRSGDGAGAADWPGAGTAPRGGQGQAAGTGPGSGTSRPQSWRHESPQNTAALMRQGGAMPTAVR